MNVGVCVRLHKGEDILKQIEDAKNQGFAHCQLLTWDGALQTSEMASTIRAACQKHGVSITAVWAGWSGPAVWNFTQGPETLGIVPVAYRFARMKDLCRGADFAKALGVRDVVTHLGFLPENPSDANYPGVLSAIRAVMQHLRANGQRLLCETGQETPVTLLRVMQEVGEDIGINLDPANLILYGKGNPIDAIAMLGARIWGVHAKDGDYPTDGLELGQERALGEGAVDVPRLIKALHGAGYTGSLTIEREISGPQQIEDIQKGKALLERCIAQL